MKRRYKKFVVDKETLAKLYQDHTLLAIANKYGVGETTVWSKIKRYGIKLHGKPLGHKNDRRTFSLAHRQAMSCAKRGRWAGEKNPNWKGGVHQAHLRIRASGEYKQWKISALEMAGYRCQNCGAKHGVECGHCGSRVQLHVHHIMSFSANREKRFDPSNSEVLCSKCHHSRHHGKSGEVRENPTG